MTCVHLCLIDTTGLDVFPPCSSVQLVRTQQRRERAKSCSGFQVYLPRKRGRVKNTVCTVAAAVVVPCVGKGKVERRRGLHGCAVVQVVQVKQPGSEQGLGTRVGIISKLCPIRLARRVQTRSLVRRDGVLKGDDVTRRGGRVWASVKRNPHQTDPGVHQLLQPGRAGLQYGGSTTNKLSRSS